VVTAHWFADIDPEETSGYKWQPCLETGYGHVPSLPIWFGSKAKCEEWIRVHIIGAPLYVD
jgi:hypothetical protein